MKEIVEKVEEQLNCQIEKQEKIGEVDIDCLKIYGPFKGFYFGTKRILSCHPIKILGSGEGFDPVIKEIKDKK